MALDPNSIGRRTEPKLIEWTDRETLLYALGVGCGVDDLAFTTENSHGIQQQVLPTFAVIACPSWGAVDMIGTFDMSKLLHGSQQIRLFSPLPAAGRLHVVSEVADLQDKGPSKNAIVVFRSTGVDPDTGQLVAESEMTAVIRGAGGFGGPAGGRPQAPQPPDRAPDWRVGLSTREDQALIYRLSGDRNPLHSDPWFASQMAGFTVPILHGLCTYGVAGRALVATVGGGDASNITSMSSRFTSPVYPGETLFTSIWALGSGTAVFRTEASPEDGSNPRTVLDDGLAEYNPAPQS
ncbi:MaoC/PaaZ C-terminal domain-containing protein [Mycobacterium sp. EPa45]|uniref:MaoC/PaaZ C-terminal domain-containing protein n=1 Tax=Mycobacterium sp. EPa45 TaxID=1545728 RepID=UPI000641D3BB|nr:MaoC/PaaZ C-terminal domain-containing protein [Mycobacterium sp. EPa45]AKK25480.1 dehydrogenase [Mycobacterium sp. EPa45]